MKKKIMVVDDEPDQILTVKIVLENMDDEYEVISADSGMQCLQLLKDNQIPDLILLDIMMPKMSGWEIFYRLKENQLWKNIPVVFCTARGDQMANDAGSFLGDDYIEKPFDIDDLKLRIDRVLKNTSR
jgi:CheY-like chemotaxis protein